MVSYGDFLSAVDAGSFSATLQDSSGSTVQTYDSSVAGSGSAQFTLAPLTLGESYTLTVSLADEHGNVSLTGSSFYVTHDTGITPPAVPARPGWISGRVYDSGTCDQHLTTCRGLAGAQVTLVAVDPDALASVRANRAETYLVEGQLEGEFPAGADVTDSFATPVTGTLLTGPDGFYAFPVAATGVYHLPAGGKGWLHLRPAGSHGRFRAQHRRKRNLPHPR